MAFLITCKILLHSVSLNATPTPRRGSSSLYQGKVTMDRRSRRPDPRSRTQRYAVLGRTDPPGYRDTASCEAVQDKLGVLWEAGVEAGLPSGFSVCRAQANIIMWSPMPLKTQTIRRPPHGRHSQWRVLTGSCGWVPSKVIKSHLPDTTWSRVRCPIRC